MKSNKKMFIIALITGLITLSTQATLMNASSDNELTKSVYSCANKKTLDVVFVNTEENAYAIIHHTYEMIPMKSETSASGVIYKPINKEYTYELYTKGDKADLFEDGKSIISDCVAE